MEATSAVSWCAVRPVGTKQARIRWQRACAMAAAVGVLGGAALAGLHATTLAGMSSATASVLVTESDGRWASDILPVQLAAAAGRGRPAMPAVPKGWEAAWDGLAHRYSFYNQQCAAACGCVLWAVRCVFMSGCA